MCLISPGFHAQTMWRLLSGLFFRFNYLSKLVNMLTARLPSLAIVRHKLYRDCLESAHSSQIDTLFSFR